MILARIGRRLREENWVAVGIEFLILVLGVWLGLQVQEWSNARSDRSRAHQLVTDMVGDLKINRANYATALRSDRKRLTAANLSLTGAGLAPLSFDWTNYSDDLSNYALGKSDMMETSELRPDQLWTGIIMGNFPVNSRTAYDAMVGAGDSRLIGDRGLVREIQLFQNQAETVNDQNKKLMSIREEGLRVGAKFGLAPYASMPASQYYRLIAANPELAATIRNQATFTIFHYGDIKIADQRAATLQKRLEAYLDRLK